MLSSWQACSIFDKSAKVPAKVTESMLLWQAISIKLPRFSRSSNALAPLKERFTAAIRPVPRVNAWARLRTTITVIASFKLSDPDAQAAAISPTLWPRK